MPRQVTLLDGATGNKLSSLELLVGEAQTVTSGSAVRKAFTLTLSAPSGTAVVNMTTSEGWDEGKNARVISVNWDGSGSRPDGVALGGAWIDDDTTGDITVAFVLDSTYPGGDVTVMAEVIV